MEIESYHKPSYDGRQEYYEHLRQYWEGMAAASITSNIDAWYRYMRGFFSRARPFLKQTEREALQTRFNKLQLALNQTKMKPVYNKIDQQLIDGRIHGQLQEVEDMLFMAAKDLLVPTKSDEDEDFDVDKFMKGSDL